MLVLDNDWRSSWSSVITCKSTVDIAAKFRCDGSRCVAVIFTPDARTKGIDSGVRRQWAWCCQQPLQNLDQRCLAACDCPREKQRIEIEAPLREVTLQVRHVEEDRAVEQEEVQRDRRVISDENVAEPEVRIEVYLRREMHA